MELKDTNLINDANLRAYFRMESGALGTDESGNNYTMTEEGTPTEQTGKYGGAVGCSGSPANYLSKVSNLGITTNSQTISLWFRLVALPDGTSDIQFYTWNSGDTNDNGFTLSYEYNGGTYRFNARWTRWNIAHNNNYYNVTLNTGQWYHIALIKNNTGTKIQMYLNNSLVIDATYTTGNGTGTTEERVWIGRLSNGVYMDDIGVFDRVLTTYEITQLATGILYDDTLTETINFTDTLLKIPSRILSETINIAESILKKATKVLSEAISVTENFAIMKVIYKLLVETIYVSESFVKSISRSLSEAITTTDSITKLISKTLSEAISITETFTTAMKNTLKTIASIVGIKFSGKVDDDEDLRGKIK